MRKRLGRRRLLVVSGLAVIATVVAVSGTWAALGGGTAPATFRVTLGGEDITTARSYVVDGAVLADKKSTKQYTVRLTLGLTDNAAPVQAFQAGQTFGSLTITLYTNDLRPLKVYTWANATVVGYKQTGDASTNTFAQDLVLQSTSLTVTAG